MSSIWHKPSVSYCYECMGEYNFWRNIPEWYQICHGTPADTAGCFCHHQRLDYFPNKIKNDKRYTWKAIKIRISTYKSSLWVWNCLTKAISFCVQNYKMQKKTTEWFFQTRKRLKGMLILTGQNETSANLNTLFKQQTQINENCLLIIMVWLQLIVSFVSGVCWRMAAWSDCSFKKKVYQWNLHILYVVLLKSVFFLTFHVFGSYFRMLPVSCVLDFDSYQHVCVFFHLSSFWTPKRLKLTEDIHKRTTLIQTLVWHQH